MNDLEHILKEFARAVAAAMQETVSQTSPSIVLTPVRYVTIKRAAEMTGYSQAAIRHKIERGDWREGKEYVRAPDGRILVNLKGYEAWAAGGTTTQESRSEKTQSGSTLCGKESSVANRSRLSLPCPT